mmetsp:Transcript_6392/g.8407  ORF Transcript_6392/g.8407 Transcript_6392/m.8407 type:complete len:87 (-) Transcript_6392:21-281(-)
MGHQVLGSEIHHLPVHPMMDEGRTWLFMKYEVILLSASMFSERCTMLCSLDEKCDRQKKFESRGRKRVNFYFEVFYCIVDLSGINY